MIVSRQRPAVPVDALDLNEDLHALRRMKELCGRIDPRNVSEDAEVGRKNLRHMTLQLRMFERFAEQKLRSEYLAPVKRKVK